MPFPSPRPRCWLLLSAAFLSGCGGANLTGVSGKVTLPDGTPAVGVLVTFEDAAQHVTVSGVTDADGVYQLSYLSPGDGAPPGTYRVAVRQPGPEDSGMADPPRLFPLRYESLESSGLTCVVGEDGAEFPIALQP